jgi:hypothetical protein
MRRTREIRPDAPDTARSATTRLRCAVCFWVRSVRGGDPNGEELHAPFLRMRLLRSLLLAVQAAAVSRPAAQLPSCPRQPTKAPPAALFLAGGEYRSTAPMPPVKGPPRFALG